MVSIATDSATEVRKQHGELADDVIGTLLSKINRLKRQIQAERNESVREKILKNGKRLQCHVMQFISTNSRREALLAAEHSKMLSSRINQPIFRVGASSQSPGEKDDIHNHEATLSASVIMLPCIEKLPPYTSWIFVDRNQIMAEDQSVVGRRRIYNDRQCTEALICSDSEEELAEDEEEKHEFSETEDQVLWMAFEEHGLNEEVLDIVKQFVGGTNLEIQERYKNLKEQNMRKQDQDSEGYGDDKSHMGICLDQSLSAALDSFDNLFCRRCMTFDCRLHGCSQPLIYPCEKQSIWSEHEEDKKPCSDQCYLQLKVVKNLSEGSMPSSLQDKGTAIIEKGEKILAPSCTLQQDNQITMTFFPEGSLNPKVPISESLGKQKVTDHSITAPYNSILVPDDSHSSCRKLKKVSNTGVVTVTTALNDSVAHTSDKTIYHASTSYGEHDKNDGDGLKDIGDGTKLNQLSNSIEGQVEGMPSLSLWKPMEKELYMNGLEIFGRNSCLIARNLLSGLKTCMEVYSYMHAGGASGPHGSPSPIEGDGKTDAECIIPTKPRMLRKRGRTRKFKYTLKSASRPSMRKRIADGNSLPKHYTPCECQPVCGKHCPCLQVGNCCEKYCGCLKSCKNRFRGCHCSKSQCRARQCPCFAARRECDPDLCRNCWVSCGDGSLGEPPKRGDSQCGNMMLLLGQQKRILLGKSDVEGWGAFLKDSINKNDCLGEYTGELISHREADKRGKMYDRANSSFLFDLDDQYVLDASRKGDKLKFANHSSNPNCYARVLLVAGDHRVGIFAKENIEASEELFYDYSYKPDSTPEWARKLGTSKRGESSVPRGRAKKHH